MLHRGDGLEVWPHGDPATTCRLKDCVGEDHGTRAVVNADRRLRLSTSGGEESA
jgi:hypothetical protein